MESYRALCSNVFLFVCFFVVVFFFFVCCCCFVFLLLLLLLFFVCLFFVLFFVVVVVVFSPVQHGHYLALGRESPRAFVCLSCMRPCLLSVLFSSSWCREVAVVCDCGTPWTFLLNFAMLRWLSASIVLLGMMGYSQNGCCNFEGL